METLSQLRVSRASRLFRASQTFRASQSHEMREFCKTTYTADSDDIRQDDNDGQKSLLKKEHAFIEPKELHQLFSPENYNKRQRKALLHKMGGISRTSEDQADVLDGLNVWHDRGLTAEYIEQRIRKYGVNSENAHYFRQLLSSIWSELSNPLVHYLLVFLLAILVLGSFNQYPQEHHTVLAILLVLVIIVVRSLMARSIQTQVYRRLKQSHNNTVEVRRDEQIMSIAESETLVGDIMLLKKHDIVMVDGILLKGKDSFTVNQNLTVLNDDEVAKTGAWNESLDSDPFILAGSEVTHGSGEMLVCTVGENCSLRVVTRLPNYQTAKTHFLTKLINTLERFFKLTKSLVMMLVLIELFVQLLRLSPLQWQDIRIIFLSIVQSLALLFLVDKQNIPDYLYCYVENNCVSRDFKIVKKQTIEDIMGLDVLLIEQRILNLNEQIRTRQQCYIYELPNESIIEDLRKVVDVKILTRKSMNECKNYKLKQVYSVNRYLMAEKDIKDLKSCAYVADCGVPGVVESIINTFVVLGYRVGVATVSQEQLRQQCLVITTSMAPEHVHQNSWVRIDNYDSEKGLLQLFLVSTVMHLMKGAYALLLINNTLVLAVGYLLMRELQPQHILTLALIQNLIIYYVSSHIGQAAIKQAQPISAVKRDIVFFNITTGCFYLYVFLRLQHVHNQFIFLVCNTVLRGMYVLRYGAFLPQRRMAFLRLHYLLIIVLLVCNLVVSYFSHRESIQEQLMLIIMTCFLQVLHLLQRMLTRGLRGLF